MIDKWQCESTRLSAKTRYIYYSSVHSICTSDASSSSLSSALLLLLPYMIIEYSHILSHTSSIHLFTKPRKGGGGFWSQFTEK